MKKMMLGLVAVVALGAVADDAGASGGDWIYLPSEGILSNTVWSVNVTVKDADQRKLTIGSSGEGSAYTTRGEGTLDFSTRVHELNDDGSLGQEWTITAFAEAAFVPGETLGNKKLTAFVFPEAVESIGNDLFYVNESIKPYSALTNIVLASETLTGTIPGRMAYGLPNLMGLTVRTPLVTAIGAQAFRYSGTRSADIDLGAWDLSGVKTVAHNILNDTRGTKGALDLPVVKTIARNAFNGTGITSLLLGTNDAVTAGTTLTLGDSNGSQSFANCASLESITIGPYADIVYAFDNPGDFSNAVAITRVRFLGAPLEHTEDFLDRLLASVPERMDGTKQVIIRASSMQGWTSYARTDYSANELNEKSKLEETLGEDEEVMGVYQTTDGARKAWLVDSPSLYDANVYSFSCFDERLGDSIQFLEGAPVDGVLKRGTTVKISAVCPNSEFVRWEGLPAGASPSATSPVVEFTVGRDPINITLYSRPSWVYRSTDGIISNAFWSLNVSVKDASQHKLSVGVSGTEGSAYTDRGEGILDLSGRVVELDEDGVAGQAWTITDFITTGFIPSETNGNKKVTTFIFPETVESIGKELFSKDTKAKAYLAVTNIVLVSETFSGTIPSKMAYGVNLTGLTIRTPLAKKIDSQAFRYSGATGAVVDFSAWDLSGVQTVSQNALHFDNGSTGELNLPSVTSIARNVLNGTGVTSLVLGTNDAVTAGKTLTLGDTTDSRSFANCTSLESITIGPYADVAYGYVNKCDFSNAVAVARIRFMGRPLTKTADFLDRIVMWVPAPAEDGTKQVVIRASEYLGWKAFADVDYTAEELTAKAALEKTLAPRERVMGVYVSTDLQTGERQRKAWLVHKASPYDPRGTIIIVH